MTGEEAQDVDVTVVTYDGELAFRQMDVVGALYGEVYSEPPYDMADSDVDQFADDWARRVSQPGFRLALAIVGGQPAGFTFGHQLRVDTQWWDGAVEPMPEAIVTERPGRTVAIIELGVRKPYRRRHVARALHAALLQGRAEERVTLLARPNALAAQSTYAAWGYAKVGRIQPRGGAPVYDAMLRSLPV